MQRAGLCSSKAMLEAVLNWTANYKTVGGRTRYQLPVIVTNLVHLKNVFEVQPLNA